MSKASKIAAALRRRFKTPRDALKALGLDESILETREINLTHDRMAYDQFHRRRYGLDADPTERQAMVKDALRRACDADEPLDPVEIVEILLEHASPEEVAAIGQCAREIAVDHAGPSGWAKDRAERRRLGRDLKLRRTASDDPPPFGGEPLPGGRMRPDERDHRLEGVLSGDARRGARDMAYDRAETSADAFARLFPNAPGAQVE